MYMVELKNVSLTLGDNEILNNINLNIRKGDMIAILGINGSGKSMLLRIMCGLMEPTSGEVLINGIAVDVNKPAPTIIGVMIEQPGFWLSWNGMENLSYLQSLTRSVDKNEIKELLERVGLENAGKKPFKKYSMGMKQRLAFAQAIMDDPELLVLDEATNGLDDSGSKMVLDILSEEKARGKTIVITTHINEHVKEAFDAIYRINNGVLMELEGDD